MSQPTDACTIVAVPASTDCVPCASHQTSKRGPRGGIYDPFPLKFHRALDQIRVEGMESIVSWVSHGRAFKIHKPKVFAATISKILLRTLDGTLMSDSALMSHSSFARLADVDTRIRAYCSAEIL
jgi:hypothetical protein